MYSFQKQYSLYKERIPKTEHYILSRNPFKSIEIIKPTKACFEIKI